MKIESAVQGVAILMTEQHRLATFIRPCKSIQRVALMCNDSKIKIIIMTAYEQEFYYHSESNKFNHYS